RFAMASPYISGRMIGVKVGFRGEPRQDIHQLRYLRWRIEVHYHERNPITGIAGCCARAASGHATAEPAIALMKSRRRIGSSSSRGSQPTTFGERHVVHHS